MGGCLIYSMSVMNVACLLSMAGYSIPQKVTLIEIPMSNLILVIESNGKRVSGAFGHVKTPCSCILVGRLNFIYFFQRVTPFLYNTRLQRITFKKPMQYKYLTTKQHAHVDSYIPFIYTVTKCSRSVQTVTFLRSV